MLTFLAGLPWVWIGLAYIGLIFYVLTSLSNPADESLGSLRDVFVGKGKTLLTACLAVPILVMMLQKYDQLNEIGAFTAGYLNTSVIRKVVETWRGKSKLLGDE